MPVDMSAAGGYKWGSVVTSAPGGADKELSPRRCKQAKNPIGFSGAVQ